jgi:hypothetical protein
MKRREFLLGTMLSPLFMKDIYANQNDIYLYGDEWRALVSLNHRLKRLRRYVGFGNFNTISYNHALYYARNYPKIGEFTKDELKLIERLFFEDPKKYGFYGKRTTTDLEKTILSKDIVKIPYTGHYLYRGQPEQDYKSLIKDVGPSLILTSGVRNIIKQLSLYVNKIYHLNGNITQASVSLAPPGYSYHTISDFDVGRKGWGYKNFTADFATTEEFSKMTKLNYIGMRYDYNNLDGVRFEPWHVEVI